MRAPIPILTDEDTEFQFPIEEVQPRPEDGSWLNISWLFGADGLLGKWAGFHGDDKGVLRLDWGTSWRVAAGQPVSDMIRSRLGNTLLLMSTATLVSLIDGGPHRHLLGGAPVQQGGLCGHHVCLFWPVAARVLVWLDDDPAV